MNETTKQDILAGFFFGVLFCLLILSFIYQYNSVYNNNVPELSRCSEYRLCTEVHGETECIIAKTIKDFDRCESIIPSKKICVTEKYLYSIICIKDYYGKTE